MDASQWQQYRYHFGTVPQLLCCGGVWAGTTLASSPPAHRLLLRRFADMLHDDARNAAYARAIQAVVTRADLVLDIGAGSGLLVRDWPVAPAALLSARSPPHCVIRCALVVQGLLAARAGAKAVVGVEVVPELAAAAVSNAAVNGCADRYVVQLRHSTAISSQSDLFDGASPTIILGELLDTWLLGEGLLASMRHAASVLAQTGSFVAIPSRT